MKNFTLSMKEIKKTLYHKILIFCFLVITLFSSNFAFGQAEIIGLSPNSSVKGTNYMIVVVRGINTNFIQGKTTFDLGNGITVNSINVIDPLSISVNLSISSNAMVGSRNLTITTGTERVNLPNAFEVEALGNGISAQLEVVPVQSLSISDFDGKNVQQAPILFNIRVFNENVQHNLKVIFKLSSSKFGPLGSAEKLLNNVSPNQMILFSNREFGKYDVSKSSSQFIDEVMQSGSLPAGEYFYKVFVLDEKLKIVAEADGSNTISNPTTGLNLISPGNPTNENPDVIKNKFPQFQWFSQASSFDFKLWKLDKNAILPNDLTSRLPMYELKGIFGNQLIYPVSARLLEESATYAWQITGYVNDSKGKKAIKSELFWFSLTTTDNNYVKIDKIDMIPNEMTLGFGDTLTFKIHALNEKAETITIKPQWKVVPADAGTITQYGKFTAGNRPKTAAIVASVKGVEEYATVNIVSTLSGNWSFDDFFKKVFGLPADIKK